MIRVGAQSLQTFPYRECLPVWQIFPLEVVLLYIHRIARWINLPFFQFIQNNVEGSPFVIKSNIHQVMTFILVLLYAVTFFQDRTYPTEGAASGGTAGYG